MEKIYTEFVNNLKEYKKSKKKFARSLYKKVYSHKYGTVVVARKMNLSDSGLRKYISRTKKLKTADGERLIEIYQATKKIDKEYELLEKSK